MNLWEKTHLGGAHVDLSLGSTVCYGELTRHIFTQSGEKYNSYIIDCWHDCLSLLSFLW